MRKPVAPQSGRERPAHVRVVGSRDSVAASESLLSALHRLLAQHEPLLPAAPDVLAAFLPQHLQTTTLGDELSDLIDRGELRRVVVGREAHIALPGPDFRRTQRPAAETPHATSTSAEADAERAFTLAVEADLERERVLLFRVGIVVELVLTSVLVRALVLWALDL